MWAKIPNLEVKIQNPWPLAKSPKAALGMVILLIMRISKIEDSLLLSDLFVPSIL